MPHIIQFLVILVPFSSVVVFMARLTVPCSKMPLKTPKYRIAFNSIKSARVIRIWDYLGTYLACGTFLVRIDITILKTSPKNPHIPNFIQLGQAIREIKTTSGSTGSDVTVQWKWYHHVEMHPKIPLYTKFHPIRPSDSRDKNYFRFNRKWRHRTVKVTSPCWKAPKNTPTYQISSNSAKRFARWKLLPV